MRKIYVVFILMYLNSCFCYSQLPADIKQEFKESYAKHDYMGLTRPECMTLGKCEKLDTCILRVTYQVTFVNDTSDRAHTSKDIQVLEVGKNVIHSYSAILRSADSIATEMDKRGSNTIPCFNKYIIPEDIFVFIAKRQIEERYRTNMSLSDFFFKEELSSINWNLINEHKNILGYNCQKACCQYRGRKYIAWYTLDIPLRYGPYKFYDLPGLILQIYDSSNDYIWECISVQKGKPNDFICRYPGKYRKVIEMTREKARKNLMLMHKDIGGYMRSVGKGIIVSNSKGICYTPVAGDIPPEPYNPIEKE